MRDPFEVLGRQPEPTQPPSAAFVADLMAAVEERLDTHARTGTAAATPSRPRAVAVIDPEVAPMHRQPTPNRRWLLVAAGLVLVAAAALLLTWNRGDDAQDPSGVSTTAPATTAVDAAPMALALQQRWMGGKRSFTFAPEAGTSLVFGADSYRMTQSDQNDTNPVHGTARPIDADRFEAQSDTDVLGCDAAARGTYRWALSPTGRTLTITAESDPCAARASTLEGTYWLSACFNTGNNCLGPMDAGEYSTQYVAPRRARPEPWEPSFGAVTYTVPDGWANSTDFPNVLGFGTADEYPGLTEAKPFGDNELYVVVDPKPATNSCDQFEDSQDPAALLAQLDARPGISMSDAVPVQVGGISGLQVDLGFDDSAFIDCDGLAAVPLLHSELIGSVWDLGVLPEQNVRLIVLDPDLELDVPMTAILVQGMPDRWDRFLPEAMAVIDSMQFR